MTDYRLGIDIGGTFTDFCLLDEATGSITVLKTSSTPDKPEKAIATGVKQLVEEHQVEPAKIEYFIHGTTLAVNTIIQRRGEKTALLVTEGFRDVLNIGRHRIPDVFNFQTEIPAPLVPRSQVYEIPERCMANGKIRRRVDEEAVRVAVRKILASDVKAVAVCFLHSYRNASNEEIARSVIESEAPDLYVSLSSDIWPQMREYERALAAVMNAYVGQKMRKYFLDLEADVRELGVRVPVLSTKSNGGIMPASEAKERPVETLLSGPASGVIGAAFVGNASGFDRLITLDMGGTSADVAVIEGAPRYSTESHVGDFPIIMPAIDVTSIGAGGGSIAWTNSSRVLKVGPESAGAVPGPACYDQNGSQPTVTDAYVCLGIIHPDKFLGGRVSLRRELATAAMERLGSQLGLSSRDTAEAVLRVATSQMYSALIPLLARKGIDYEDYTLLAFGGGGPCHAFMLAHDVGIKKVLVPPQPGTLCAAGSLAADVRKDLVRTVHSKLSEEGGTVQLIKDALEQLSQEGTQWLDALGLAFVDRKSEWRAEVRYVGQSFEIAVGLDAADLTDQSGKGIRKKFQAIYQQIYGHVDDSAELEVLDVHVTAIGVNPMPRLARLPDKANAQAAPKPEHREIYLEGRTWQAGVYQRDDLRAGHVLKGPAIIEQYDTTVFVTPGFSVSVDDYGNLIGEADHAV